MSTRRRYPAEVLNRLNMAVENAPVEAEQPAPEVNLIALPGRLVFLGILFGLIGLLVIGRLIYLQTSPTFDDWENSKPDTTTHLFFPPRGEIYDRWGRLMAGNELLYEVGANVVSVDSPRSIAFAMAKVLTNHVAYNNPVYTSADYEADILTRFENAYKYGSPYVLLADYVTPDELAELKRWVETYSNLSDRQDQDGNPISLDGLVYRERLGRIYTEETLFKSILGFVNGEGQGLYGVEGHYDERLAGIPENLLFSADPSQANNIPPAQAGDDLILTLDREMQAAVMDILEDALVETGAKSGTVVVMDPNTGEILAMVSLPIPELRPYWEDQLIQDVALNRAVNEEYEPGSVFKVLTMAAALDAGVVTPETIFTDLGFIEIGGAIIRNWDGGAWGDQTMQGCLQHSLNVCLTWVAIQLGVDRFYSYMQDFGFGHMTGIDLADEASGRLKLPIDDDWQMMDLGMNSFGQGITVTPVQMLMAISAVANLRGEMVMPHVLLSTVTNGTQYSPRLDSMGHPISAETAQVLTEMLYHSLENESSVALVDGYAVAGKTGTAQLVINGKYDDTLTNASFVGWGPIDEPRFLIYVWLEQPESSPWGSVVAAPVFSEVFEQMAILADLPKDEVRWSLATP
mgnify:CR=1 FL=1